MNKNKKRILTVLPLTTVAIVGIVTATHATVTTDAKKEIIQQTV